MKDQKDETTTIERASEGGAKLVLAYGTCLTCDSSSFPPWLTEDELCIVALCLEGCGSDLEWVVERVVQL